MGAHNSDNDDLHTQNWAQNLAGRINWYFYFCMKDETGTPILINQLSHLCLESDGSMKDEECMQE